MTTIKCSIVTGALIVMVALIVGCADVSHQGGFTQVQHLVMERSNHHVAWRQGGPADQQLDAAIVQALEHELSVEQAAGIALMNNRRMQATWEELGIMQADVVQAGLLKNPTFGILSRWPSASAGTGANIDVDLMFDFLDLALLPTRKRLAALQFQQVRLRVAHEALDLVRRVEESYYTLQGARQVYQMRMLAFEAADASYELARRMHNAGNINALELERERGLLEQNRVDAARAEMQAAAAREALARLMGLYGPAVEYRVKATLEGLPDDEPALDHVETLAIEHRLDLAAALHETQTLAQALGITRNYRYLLLTEIGVDSERELDGTWLTGPHVTLELPIFDQKQAVIAKAEAQLQQSENQLWALAVEIRSEAREARDRMLAARRLAVHYRDVIIPLRERIVQRTTEQYNFMLVGVFEVIAAREDEYAAYQDYIEAVRDYRIARSQLAAAVGGRLPQLPPTTTQPADAPVETPPAPATARDAHEPVHQHEPH